MPPKFKVGERVLYLSGSEDNRSEREVLIIDQYDTPYMRMYSLNTGFSVGECHLRREDDPLPYPIETMKDSNLYMDIVTHRFGGLLSKSGHQSVKEKGEKLLEVSRVDKEYMNYEEEDFLQAQFFKPNKAFAKWLIKRFDNKIFIDVGCGKGHITEMLMKLEGRGCGIDLYHDALWELKRIKFLNNPKYGGMLHLIQADATKSTFVRDCQPESTVLLFCRPCHGNFVEETIKNAPSGVEVYYITVPKNIQEYNDLGYYKRFAEKLEHEGTSVDNEVVYYFKKP